MIERNFVSCFPSVNDIDITVDTRERETWHSTCLPTHSSVIHCLSVGYLVVRGRRFKLPSLNTWVIRSLVTVFSMMIKEYSRLPVRIFWLIHLGYFSFEWSEQHVSDETNGCFRQLVQNTIGLVNLPSNVGAALIVPPESTEPWRSASFCPSPSSVFFFSLFHRWSRWIVYSNIRFCLYTQFCWLVLFLSLSLSMLISDLTTRLLSSIWNSPG